MAQLEGAASPLEKLDLVAALKRTVEVLERTRQNFKCKGLGELRYQPERLLSRP